MNSVEWLSKLIAFDTTSRGSNLELINAVQDWFLMHQIETRLTYDSTRQKANLFATISAKDGSIEGGLILSGHTDQVPVDDQVWESDPFKATIRNGRLYGRGSCDMKGFLAVILTLVPTIQKLGLNYPIHFAFSYDEEVGCLGARFLIADFLQAKFTPKACIVGEPTLLRPVIAHKGIQAFKCLVHGHAVHSSLTMQGSNAIEYAANLISIIRSIAEKFKREGPFDHQFDVPYSTLSTNKIRGGHALNIIPSLCEFFFELRHLPRVNPDEVIAHINAFIQNEKQTMQASVKTSNIELCQLAHAPSFEADKNHALFDIVSKVSGATPYKVAYATEAGLFQAAHINTLVWGPGNIEQAHGANEYIAIEQLQKCEDDLIKIFLGLNDESIM